MESETPVQTLLARYHCDDCGGLVEYTDGNMLMTNPPKFEHSCDSCGKKYIFFHKYPYTKYVFK